MDFSTIAHMYDAPCHLVYFCVLIITTGNLEMQRTRKQRKINSVREIKHIYLGYRHIFAVG